LISISDSHKAKLLPLIKQLDEAGWEIYSTSGTHAFLSKNGVGSYFVYKMSEKSEPNIQTLISQRKVDLIINLPTDERMGTQTDGYYIRRMAVDHHLPLITNLQIAHVMLQCLIQFKGKSPESLTSWQQFMQRNLSHQIFLREAI
jgi:predicted RNA binding protein YcfA (HicA-like mRNA interferase family)